MRIENRAVEDIYIFLLVHKESHRILDGNRLAKNYYGWEEEAPQLMDIFSNLESINNPLQNLEEEESIRLYGVTSIKANGDKFICDIEMSYTDKNQHLVFFTIKDRVVDSNQSLLEVVELVDNPVVVFDLDARLRVHFGSYKFYQSIRQTKLGFQQAFDGSYGNFLDEMRRVAFTNSVSQQLSRGAECHVDIEISYDGYYYHLFYLNAFQSIVDGRLYGVLISLRNPSALVKRIAYDQQFIDVIQEFSKDLLFRVDVESKTLVHRGDVSRFYGLLPEMREFPESMRESGLIHSDDVDGYMASIYRMLHGQGANFELRLRMQCGKYQNFRLQGKPLFDSEGKTVQIVGRMENIQKYTEIEERANYDQLTGSFDEKSFHDLLENILNRAVQQDRHSLLILDFDNFNQVKKEKGEEFAEFLLEVAGRRIMSSTRNVDKVGRLGGARFAVFFPYAPTKMAVMERVNTILYAMSREFQDGTDNCRLGCSIGVALYPEHGDNYADLFDKAHMALARSHYLGGEVATLYHFDLE